MVLLTIIFSIFSMDQQKERNKELEARAREAERKVVEERTLREAADAKVKVFRKKLRGLKGENGAGIDAETVKEEEPSSGNSINGKEPTNSDISPAVNPIIGVEGEDSKAMLVPVQRETSTGNNGNANDPNKPTGSAGGNIAAGNQGTNKTPPRGNVVGQKGQKAAQKRTPTSPVPRREPGSSSDSAARAAAASIPLPGRGTAMQRNSSASSLPVGHPSSNPPVNNANKDSSSVHPANNFDPLRPTSQSVSIHGKLPHSNSGGSVNSLSQAPIYMVNQHNMAVPVLSVPVSAMEGGADLMEFQSQPMMQIATHLQQGNGGAGNQNYQDSQQHTQGSGGYDDVQQPMLLVSQHQFTGMQQAGMQQPHMMTIQQPVLQFHQGVGGPHESGWIQPTSDTNQWTHQHHGQPAAMLSSQQPGTMAPNASQPSLQSSQPNATSGAAPHLLDSIKIPILSMILSHDGRRTSTHSISNNISSSNISSNNISSSNNNSNRCSRAVNILRPRPPPCYTFSSHPRGDTHDIFFLTCTDCISSKYWRRRYKKAGTFCS
jgi:hypothetical protein